MIEEHEATTCVQDIVKGIQKEQRLIDAKSRDIHRRAAKMIEDGRENMSKGIEKVAKKIPPFEREITAKVKDIHNRADDMVAEGKKRMTAGIEAAKDGIHEQIRKNNAAIKEMNSKIDKYEGHIRGFEREMAHFTHLFYYGEPTRKHAVRKRKHAARKRKHSS